MSFKKSVDFNCKKLEDALNFTTMSRAILPLIYVLCATLPVQQVTIC